MFMIGFLAGFFGLLLFALVLKWVGWVGQEESKFVALEKSMKAELDGRLFALSQQWNTSLTNLQNQINVKDNPFIPHSPAKAAMDLKQLESEFWSGGPQLGAEEVNG